MTTTQAAAELGLNNSRVRQLIRTGELPARREETPRGPVYWIGRQALEEFRKRRAAEAEARRGKPGRPPKA